MDLESSASSRKTLLHRLHRSATFELVAFKTLGIIYGDIGTSPLYVLNGIFGTTTAPSAEDIIGAVSAIVWALTLVPLIKYCLIVLNFGTERGEGGSFALYIRIARACGFSLHGNDEDFQIKLTDYESREKGSTKGIDRTRDRGSQLRQTPWLRNLLCYIACFGAALTISDGLLTPAVSVVSAVEGMAIAKPELTQDIVPISVAILVVLFFGQHWGTNKISFLFSPLVAIWMLLFLIIGITNVLSYPGIFRAFDISRAVLWFVRTGNYDALGGVLLSITGVEALFADLGYFSKNTIRCTFSFVVYPCLVIMYLGQGAKMISEGDAVMGNVFYQTIPFGGGFYWFVFVMAIVVTIIASQAMISATFALLQQAIAMNVIPPIRVRHTSSNSFIQVCYDVPNWIMCLAVVGLVAGFGTSLNLTNAYGFAVATVMITTTLSVCTSMVVVEHYNLLIPIAFGGVFLFIDCIFWGATFRKVPHGAWFPLALGTVLLCFMIFWKWARETEVLAERMNRTRLSSILTIKNPTAQTFLLTEGPSKSQHESSLEMAPQLSHAEPGEIESIKDLDAIKPVSSKDSELAPATIATQVFNFDSPISINFAPNYNQLVRVPGFAIFNSAASGNGVPLVFKKFIRQCASLPKYNVFLGVHFVTQPFVNPVERLHVHPVPRYEGFFECEYRVGYLQSLDLTWDGFVQPLVSQIANIEGNNGNCVRQAATNTTTLFLGDLMLNVSHGKRWQIKQHIKAFLLNEVYSRLKVIFGDGVSWNIQHDSIVRIGVWLDL